MTQVKMPEPVTADEIRFGMRRIDADQQYIEVEQAEAYAQAMVDEVASVAIGALKESLCGQLGEIEQRDIVNDVAAAIRALKEQS